MALLKTASHTQEKVSLPWKSCHLPSSLLNYSQLEKPWHKSQPTAGRMPAERATQGWDVCGPMEVRNQEERPQGLAKIRTYHQMDLSPENVISHHRRVGGKPVKGTQATGWISRKIGGNDHANTWGVRAGELAETAQSEPRIRDSLRQNSPGKQYIGRRLFRIVVSLCLQKEKSTEVSLEIPASSILWHTPRKISRIRIVGEPSGLPPAPAPFLATPSSEDKRLSRVNRGYSKALKYQHSIPSTDSHLLHPISQKSSRDKGAFNSLIPSHLLTSTHTSVTRFSSRNRLKTDFLKHVVS